MVNPSTQNKKKKKKHAFSVYIFLLYFLYFFTKSNRIRKIEGLESLVNLDELYLSDNGIDKLEGLTNNVSNFCFFSIAMTL